MGITIKPQTLTGVNLSNAASNSAVNSALPPTATKLRDGSQQKRVGTRNVLLLVVDCLRADRVIGPRSCRTPILDRIVGDSMAFSQAISSVPLTTPSFATLLTGCFPPRHGLRELRGSRLGSVVTLPEVLRDQHDYHTHAEVTGPLLPFTGLDRGFQGYVYRQPGTDATWWNRIGDTLRSLPQPWFALVHVWNLHRPRRIHPQLNNPAFGKTRYDRAMSTLDQKLSQLFKALSSDDIIVLTGDHGEMIEQFYGHAFLSNHAIRWARRWPKVREACFRIPASHRLRRLLHVGHGFHLYEELIRVPLVIRAAGLLPAGTRPDLASHVDVLPTVLDLLGFGVPSGLDGRSLRSTAPPRPIFIETAASELQMWKEPLQGVRTSNHKYLRRTEPPYGEILFDLLKDPRENWNRASKHPSIVASLRRELAAFLQTERPTTPMSAEEDALVTERLRELGYLE